MKKTYVVINDVHKFTKYELPLEAEHEAIYNGDIFDLYGCKYKDVGKVIKHMAGFRELVGDRYNYGNHEMMHDRMFDHYIKNNIVFAHGHVEFWGTKKTRKFMSKTLGKTSFQRFLSKAFNKARMLKPFHMSKKQKNRCIDRCIDTNCNTIVLGRKHPVKKKDFTYTKGLRTIRIIILPRGRNEVTI